MFIGYIVAVLLLVLLVAGLRIANQYERAVIFRLGKYARTSGPGLYLLIPLIEWQVTIDMRTMTTAVEQQEAITKDNVPVKINAVIWRKTIDPKRAVIEVVDVGNSVVQVAVTALRNVIGQHTLDDVLKEQEAISRALQTSIDHVTEPWGVKVERVQMKSKSPNPCSAPWRKKPRRCGKSAPAKSRRRRNSKPRRCCGKRPRSSCKARPGSNCAACR